MLMAWLTALGAIGKYRKAVIALGGCPLKTLGNLILTSAFQT